MDGKKTVSVGFSGSIDDGSTTEGDEDEIGKSTTKKGKVCLCNLSMRKSWFTFKTSSARSKFQKESSFHWISGHMDWSDRIWLGSLPGNIPGLIPSFVVRDGNIWNTRRIVPTSRMTKGNNTTGSDAICILLAILLGTAVIR